MNKIKKYLIGMYFKNNKICTGFLLIALLLVELWGNILERKIPSFFSIITIIQTPKKQKEGDILFEAKKKKLKQNYIQKQNWRQARRVLSAKIDFVLTVKNAKMAVMSFRRRLLTQMLMKNKTRKRERRKSKTVFQKMDRKKFNPVSSCLGFLTQWLLRNFL